MHSKKGQTVFSFLGDKITTLPVQGTSEVSTFEERSQIAYAHLKIMTT